MILRIRLRTLGLALLVLLALSGVGTWLFVFYGIYNVAATQQHIEPVYTLLKYALHRSIVAESQDVIAPPNLIESTRIRSGVTLYQAHCVQCHGAPGVAPAPLAFGMTPVPVNLMHSARQWKAGQIFWTVKHGIKMTGMPAWEWRLRDEQIWDITAFVKAMAVMSPLEYASLADAVPRHAQPGAAPTWRPDARGADSAASPVLGNARIGKEKVKSFLCATCHVIPDSIGATSMVGPPLDGIGGRSFIAGVIRNRPENMVRFLLNPQQVDPLSAMPPLGLSEQDARDVAAYLYTLQKVE